MDPSGGARPKTTQGRGDTNQRNAGQQSPPRGQETSTNRQADLRSTKQPDPCPPVSRPAIYTVPGHHSPKEYIPPRRLTIAERLDLRYGARRRREQQNVGSSTSEEIELPRGRSRQRGPAVDRRYQVAPPPPPRATSHQQTAGQPANRRSQPGRERVRSLSPLPRRRPSTSPKREGRRPFALPKYRAPSGSIYPQYFPEKFRPSAPAPPGSSSLEDCAPKASYRRKAGPQRPLYRPTDTKGANECLEFMRIRAPSLDKVIDKFFGMVLKPRSDEDPMWEHFKEVAPVDPAAHYRGRAVPVQENWKKCFSPHKRFIYVAQRQPSKLENIEEDFYLEDSDDDDDEQ